LKIEAEPLGFGLKMRIAANYKLYGQKHGIIGQIREAQLSKLDLQAQVKRRGNYG
jgi:hypothetical protein